MAMNKLERIEKDIEKTKGKIAELQKQLRELEAAKTEQENLQIVQLVRGPQHDPAGVRRLCARRRVAGGPGSDLGL